MSKGEVFNTFADGNGIWHVDIEAAEGNGPQEVFGCSWQTVRNRAAKALHYEISQRQGQAIPVLKAEFVSMMRRESDGKFFARFREQ